ncbi:MAG: HesB/IscA family protein [Alphaproteobacteria bacterium]
MTVFNSNLSKLDMPEKILTISEGATSRLKELKKSEEEGTFLRFWVEGGGCSGFQTRFKLDTQMNDDDYVFTNEDISVVVDETSYEFLAGSTVEFTNNLMGSWFHLTVPKAESTCSCGSSFSVPV